MIVFKTYFKIVKKLSPMILMYFSIFLVISILVGGLSTSNDIFEAQKTNVFIINNDDSKLTYTFINYVEANSNIVSLNSDEESIKDALFYREVDFVIEIPENFGNDFINNANVKIKTRSIPNSASTTYSEMLFNKFFNIAKTYIHAGFDEEKLSNLILNDLKNDVNVTLLDNSKKNIEKLNYFYNYTNYTILATCIFIVGMIINVFNKRKIKRRNLISPTSYKKLNKQLFLGNVCISFIIWLSYVAVSFIMYPNSMTSISGLLFIINSFVFTLSALSIGFLVGNLVRSKEAQSGIVNIIALGSSFLCGAFVPQEFLGDFVLNLSKIFPSYWFISNNNTISQLSNYNLNDLMPIIKNMTIILAFTIFFFTITNVTTKLKEK